MSRSLTRSLQSTHTLTLQLIDGIGLWARSVKRGQSWNKEGKLMFTSQRHIAWGLVGRLGRQLGSWFPRHSPGRMEARKIGIYWFVLMNTGVYTRRVFRCWSIVSLCLLCPLIVNTTKTGMSIQPCVKWADKDPSKHCENTTQNSLNIPCQLL